MSKSDFEKKKVDSDFYDSKEYEKQLKDDLNKEIKKDQIYGPTMPIFFKPKSGKPAQEIIKIDSDSSEDNGYEFVEKKTELKSSSDESSDEKNKKKHKKKNKKNKKKSKKKK